MYIVGSLCRQKLGASLSSVAVVVDGKRRKAKTKTARDKVAKISNYASQAAEAAGWTNNKRDIWIYGYIYIYIYVFIYTAAIYIFASTNHRGYIMCTLRIRHVAPRTALTIKRPHLHTQRTQNHMQPQQQQQQQLGRHLDAFEWQLHLKSKKV